jgi:[ribosomal protein S5]-alanine N-acetyltransferase
MMADDCFELVACERDGSLAAPCERTPDIDEICAATAGMYDRLGFDPPWIGYIAAVEGVAVGGGAFVGAPADNRVEIAYFTRAGHEGRGIATRTARRLVAIARRHSPGIEIYAKTMPEAGASTRILARLGFERIGVTTDHEIGEAWAWLLRSDGVGSEAPSRS